MDDWQSFVNQVRGIYYSTKSDLFSRARTQSATLETLLKVDYIIYDPQSGHQCPQLANLLAICY